MTNDHDTQADRFGSNAGPDIYDRAARDLRRLQEGGQPGPEEFADAPLLERWYYARHPRCGQLCLCGLISGHPRIPDGPATTSPLLAIDAHAGWARTLSRWYRLGEPDPVSGMQ